MVTTMKSITGVTVFVCLVISGLVSGFNFQTAHPGTTVAKETDRTPVLVELFTSEGCSSCPPADELLRKLDDTQPIPRAFVIALSEHVDYWDEVGWKDPFSTHENSARQEEYATRLKLDGVYTPQMVVDGQFESVGSDAGSAVLEIGKAANAKKTVVSLTSIRVIGDERLSLRVMAEPLPVSSGELSADVFIAVADDKDVSNVVRGENSGRMLTHIAVLRQMSSVGTVDRTNAFSKD